jgi:hypothetical protein
MGKAYYHAQYCNFPGYVIATLKVTPFNNFRERKKRPTKGQLRLFSPATAGLTVGGTGTSELIPWVHNIIANFKHWVFDVFHSGSTNHLYFYLTEFFYQLNRRRRQQISSAVL